MAGAGYSGTPLLKKLGIQDNMRVMLMYEPGDYLEMIEKDITQQLCSGNEKPDFIHLFVKTKKDLETGMSKLKLLLKPSTAIWVSWYKKSAGIPTDVTEDVIRNYALQNDLVDIKVCAVSAIWSGLKLVTPVAKRAKS